MQDGAGAPAGTGDDDRGGQAATRLQHRVAHVHPIAPQVGQDEAAGGRDVEKPSGASGRGRPRDPASSPDPPQFSTPTYSAAYPGASEPMKEQGAPSSARTVQELEAFPPRCHRCDKHLQGGRGRTGKSPSPSPGPSPGEALRGEPRESHC